MQELSNLVKAVSSKFSFFGYPREDIEQECWIEVMKGLDKYDENRPLNKFMYTHLKNRMLNIKRRCFHRTPPPCNLCHSAFLEKTTPPHAGLFCKEYLKWKCDYETKINIYSPQNWDEPPDALYCNNDTEVNDLYNLIDKQLPPIYRTDYLRMISGIKITLNTTKQIQKIIEGIVL